MTNEHTLPYGARGNSMVRGYLHTDGRRIRNEEGETVILKGWAAGGWMVPEGYLQSGIGGGFGMTPLDGSVAYNIRFDRGRTMNDAIRELCGTEYVKGFWPAWYRGMMGERDLKEMAELGYNSVRLPLDAAGLLYEEPGYQFNEDSLAMLDQLIDWCEQYRLYVILDLHAAVGGQSSVSCDNGIDNMPRLFVEPESWERTIVLWEELARRYRDRWIVAGYELLNEPIALEWSHYLRPELRRFYDETIARIRKLDRKHIIFLQSSSFAHDTAGFDETVDPECHNWVMVFHEHNIKPELKTVSKWLEVSLRLNVPVWYGEGSGVEQEVSFILDLLSDLGIGYNYFSWKAMDTEDHGGTAPYTYPMPDRWDEIIAYIKGKGPRPSYAESQKIFDELLENCKFEHCAQTRPELHRYMLRQPGIRILGIHYDSRFKDDDAYTAGWPYSNPFNYRSEDHTKLVVKPGGSVPGLFETPFAATRPCENLWLELSAGEHANYTIYDVDGDCPVQLKLYPLEATRLTLSYISRQSGEGAAVEVTADQTGAACSLDTVTLPRGEAYTVTVKAESGRVLICSLDFGKDEVSE